MVVAEHDRSLQIAERSSQDNLRQLLLNAASQRLVEFGPDFIDTLKRDFRGKGNVINYATKLVEAARTGDADYLARAEAEVVTDFQTAVSEHPIADTFGVYKYQLQWENGRLKSTFGYLDELIAKGIHDKTGQIPAFEKLRNQRNGELLAELTAHRTDNELPQQVFAEISPRPVNFSDPEVKARGCLDKDAISLFMPGSEGKEEITQFWFKGLELSEYQEFFQGLAALSPENTKLQEKMASMPANPTDTDVMSLSGALTPEQVEKLLTFINNHQATRLEDHSVLKQYLGEFLPREIRKNIISELYELALKLISGNTGTEEIKLDLLQVFSHLEKLQFSTRLFIKDQTGRNTFRGETAELVHNVSYQEFQQLGGDAQLLKLRAMHFAASGCGFSADNNQSGPVHMKIWGKTNSLLALLNPELYLFVCDSCGAEHEIDATLKDGAGLVPACTNCGKSASC